MAPVPSGSHLRRRVGKLAAALTSEGLAGAVVVPGPNMTYYTGVRAHLFERPFLMFVKGDGEVVLLAPKLEAGVFRDSVPMTVRAWEDTEGPSRAFDEVVGSLGKGEWGCEGRAPYGYLGHLLKRGVRLVPGDRVLESVRVVKEASELQLLRRSAQMLAKTILKVPEVLRDGVSEREVARFIAEDARAGGADEVDPMVQSGPRAADPHSETSTRRIGRGESVVIDVVSFHGGYAADITRTFVLGTGGPVERTYESVVSAQRKAIAKARAGATTGSVDAAARTSLQRDGLGRYFIHRTGHGLGLEVHEAPYIVPGGNERLAPGMVFTVEPGAYIPSKLGVRIEDDVAVSKDGTCETLTGAVPTDYGWWAR